MKISPALLTLTALLLAACNSAPPATTQPLLVPDVRSPIADVPIPAGFWLDEASSSASQNANGIRFVNHNYKGTDYGIVVARFYLDQLPKRGWSKPNLTQTGGIYRIDATKNNETVIVTVYEGIQHTHVNIKIDPTGRVTAR